MAKPIITKVDQLRRAARQSVDPQLTAALDTWAALTLEHQRQIVFELVNTRETELRLAYPEVLSIGHGFRQITLSRTGNIHKQAVTQEPCVILMVKRKWTNTRKTPAMLKRALPKHLWAFCDVRAGRGKSARTTRRLCAVPTDIISATDYRARPRDAPDPTSIGELVRASDTSGTRPSANGSLTVGIRAKGLPGLFALSCHHFLAMSKGFNGQPVAAATLALQNGDALGALSQYLGKIIRPSEGGSLDAALATVTDAAALRLALGSNLPSSALEFGELPPVTVQVIAPKSISGQPLPAAFVAAHKGFDRIRYFSSGPQPTQATVYEYQITAPNTESTKPGDSGCAVLNDFGNRFIGMHIGGVEKIKTISSRRIFILPSYLLLNPDNFGLPTSSMTLWKG